MNPNPILGIFLHAVGGFAAGSFYSPLKKIRNIAWESAWLLMGVAAWLGAPWFAAWMTTPDLDEVISESIASQPQAVSYAILFGFLWGFGNLTYGMAARYLGIALGGSIAVAFCMICGTLEPPIRKGTAGELFATPSGWAILAGISLCAIGIALCGEAGRRRDIELRQAADALDVEHFQFWKGILVAVFAGVLSGCFAIGLDRGAPIAEIALAKGTDPLYKNNSILIAVLLGGFASNALSCLILNVKNGTLRDYVRFNASYARNLALVWLAGVTWFLQFFFYGMGQSQLGQQFEFSSWSIHMAFIVVFLNLWGLVFHEWRGSSRRTKSLVWIGIFVLILSTFVIGLGNRLLSTGPNTSPGDSEIAASPRPLTPLVELSKSQ